MTLHDHAGHRLTIGHPHAQPHRTVLWCDTCDQAVLPPESSARGCASEQFAEDEQPTQDRGRCLVLDADQFGALLLSGATMLSDGTWLSASTPLVHHVSVEDVRRHAISPGCTPAHLDQALPLIQSYLVPNCRWQDAVKHALEDDLLEIRAETGSASPFRLDPP
ncbi:MAG: hypothetical protein ACR2NJ_08305 [Acidimicrobiales bacterium]